MAGKPELLAPAGSPEALRFAVQSGADAVYLGAGAFNARRSAKNFSMAELAQENLRTALDQTNHRQIKPAEGIFIMEEIQCPGLLVECGFLSNPAEEALLREAA